MNISSRVEWEGGEEEKDQYNKYTFNKSAFGKMVK